MSLLRISVAQLNMLVGDIPGNTQKVLDTAKQALDQGADLLVFPELCLTGYPPEDLLLRPSLESRINKAIEAIIAAQLPMTLLVGYPKRIDGKLFNMAGVIDQGKLVAEYAKQCLPNYQVFDEKRYFTPGETSVVFSCKGVSVGICIFEDIWFPEPAQKAKAAGAENIISQHA